MKKLLFVLPLVALCACGGSKKGEVIESVQPITATVSIVDKDASRWFHSIVWDVEANSLNTKDLAQVNRVESEAPCADSLVLYSCVRSARGQKAISGGTSVDLGTQRYCTFLQDSARTTRRVVYEVPIGSGLTLTTPWLVEYEDALYKKLRNFSQIISFHTNHLRHFSCHSFHGFLCIFINFINPDFCIQNSFR